MLNCVIHVKNVLMPDCVTNTQSAVSVYCTGPGAPDVGVLGIDSLLAKFKILYLTLLLPGPINIRKEILYQNI